ncbi:MAG: HipA domain-containing protein [Prevotellaceae bacterium]|nr:HipA domain-containing protein [Prevotellaceae bacterium]MDO4992056.1 HipA domain-containing protein [Prevotellaceae bacterium]
MCKCLCCYKPLSTGQVDFHPSCAKRFFGTKDIPTLEYSQSEMDSLAEKVIQAQTSLTGVQPKLSLNLNKHEGSSRLTIVGLWGDFIFKPQTDDYPQLPEIEDLTMHMAEVARISVVPHTLLRLADGSIGYITRRIDRTSDGEKIDMEDMCQLTLHPTEYKYRSSYEQIAKVIAAYSNTPKLCLANYMQLLLFCYITGNNDMHLKNFSLYAPKGDYLLSPAYDLLNVAIVNPKDTEELALTLNGKKSRLVRSDFLKFAERMDITEKSLNQMVTSFQKVMPKWEQLIKDSFLSEDMKERYLSFINERMNRLLI